MNKLTDKSHEVDELRKCIQTLQAQLADAKAAAARSTNVTNNQQNGNEANVTAVAAAAADQLVESWRRKIDLVYQDILSAQENFYTMSSREKLLKLRTQLKENTEKSRKTFNIDGEFMKRVSLNANISFSIESILDFHLILFYS